MQLCAVFLILASGVLTSGSVAWQLGQQLEVWAVEEDGVVSDERQLPSDRGGGDPQVAYMLLLMEGVAERPALMAQPGVGPRGFVVDRQHAAAVQQAFHGFESSLPQPAAMAP